MDIRNARDARRFVTAWSGETATRRAGFFRIAAEGMDRCKSITSQQGNHREAEDYAAAARVLRGEIHRLALPVAA